MFYQAGTLLIHALSAQLLTPICAHHELLVRQPVPSPRHVAGSTTTKAGGSATDTLPTVPTGALRPYCEARMQ